MSDFTSPAPLPQTPADPGTQPGLGGIPVDTWRNLATLGANMAVAGNARNGNGSLTYGQGFAGPLGAGIIAAQQQQSQLPLLAAQVGRMRAETGLTNAQTQDTMQQQAIRAQQLRLQQAQFGMMQNVINQDQGGTSMGGAPTPTNPLNLKVPGGTSGFQQFSAPEDGVAAAASQLRQYGAKGINTLSGVISTWAPPSDHNNTAAYIQAVAKSTGIDPNAPINLNDPNVVSTLIQHMAPMEQKGQLDPAVVQRGVAKAFTPQQQGPAPGGLVQSGRFAGAMAPADALAEAQKLYAAARMHASIPMFADRAKAEQAQAEQYMQYYRTQLEPVSIRGEGGGNESAQGVTQSNVVRSIIGPDKRTYHVTFPTIDTGVPYTRPANVPSWAPEGATSVMAEKMSPGEEEIQKTGSQAVLDEKETEKFRSAQATLRSMEDMGQQAALLNSQGPNWYQTGSGATVKKNFAATVNSLAASVGGAPIFDPDKIAAGEDILKQSKIAGMTALTSLMGGSREAASVIHSTQQAVPGVENTPQGFELVRNGIIEGSKYLIDLHNFTQQWSIDHNGDMTGADGAFAQQRSPKMYTDRAISSVRPYQISSPEAAKRYLPGTRVVPAGIDYKQHPEAIGVVPGNPDLPPANNPTVAAGSAR